MLYTQLGLSNKPNIKSEIGFNAGIVSGKIGYDRAMADDIIVKLLRVESHLRVNEIMGSIDHPAQWIEGHAKAIVTRMKDASGAIFYFLRTPYTYIALGGSSAHLISQAPRRSAKFGLSFAPDLISSLLCLERNPKFLEMPDARMRALAESGIASDTPWATMIYHQCDNRREATYDTEIKFIARTIVTHSYLGKKIILASPLYVEHV